MEEAYVKNDAPMRGEQALQPKKPILTRHGILELSSRQTPHSQDPGPILNLSGYANVLVLGQELRAF